MSVLKITLALVTFYTLFHTSLFSTKLHAANTDDNFWQRSQGFWLSDNTYLDGNLEFKVKHYRSIIEISLKQNQLITKETKFYPAKSMNFSAWGLSVPEGQGVQIEQVTVADIQENGEAIESNPQMMTSQSVTRISPINAHSALLTVRNNDAPTDSYQMFITFPDTHTRVITNIGITPYNTQTKHASMRGFSIFNGHRVDEKKALQLHKQLQREFNIGMIITTDENGKPATNTNK